MNRGGPPRPISEVMDAAGALRRAREIHGAPEDQEGSPSAPPPPAPNSPEDVGFLSQEQLDEPLTPPTVQECRSCRARIYWSEVVDEHGQKTGKRMPVDEQPDPVRGNVVLYRNRNTGRAVFARVLKKDEPKPPGTRLRLSHFATCVNAAHHRRTPR